MTRRDFENTLHAAALTTFLLATVNFFAHSGSGTPYSALQILGFAAWLLIPLSLHLATPGELDTSSHKKPTRLGPWLYLAILVFTSPVVSFFTAPALLFFHGRHLAWSRPKLGSIFLGIWMGSAVATSLGLGWPGWALTIAILFRANRLAPLPAIDPPADFSPQQRQACKLAIADKIQSWVLGLTLTIVALWLWPARDLFDGSTVTHDFSRWLTLLTLSFVAWHTLGAGLAEIRARRTAGWLLLAALAWALTTSLTTIARLGETAIFQSLVGWKPLVDALNAGERLTETHWVYAPLLFTVIYALPVILGSTAARVILYPRHSPNPNETGASTRGLSEFTFAIGLTLLLICLSSSRPIGFPTTTGLPFFTNRPKQVARAENGELLERATFAGVTRTLEQSGADERFLVDGRNFLTFGEHRQERHEATLLYAQQISGLATAASQPNLLTLAPQAWWQTRHNPLRQLFLNRQASQLSGADDILALACTPQQFPDFKTLKCTLAGMSSAWENQAGVDGLASAILVPHGAESPSLLLIAHSPESAIPLSAMADGTLLATGSFETSWFSPLAGPLPLSTAALRTTVFREIDELESTHRAQRVLRGFLSYDSATSSLLPFYLSLLSAQRYSVHDTFEHRDAEAVELDAISLQELVKIARDFPHAQSVRQTVHAMAELLVEKREVQWAHDTFQALQKDGLWQDPVVFWVRGVAALEMLDSTAAKAFAEKALAVDPKYAPALELRANATR
ncbi:MAG: hypothetical protein HOM34_06685 [Planctomycetes bacterium]|jgi:hypothetical protein|nr:hypothetical protein [Planctomycetota bacterium]MBT4559951.1 hypothetical protein [Planctomycetota bacterium]MBT5120390.1 hypothetical protein [Planctomycetota bacterium]MBT7012940.1 hypothetical protein [Planctomycetota bacterium]MBT7318258.1 hypothetical protein [Planctomycetota bacterium]